ncbi:molybdate ABC transporter substrate-binding protein [Desulfococcus multivorans]|uniref:Molybdenum ABC transporter, periplasmic molybdate-binding protein n=1 Tax=Desulfococcus multivorans DSM 2059 TaxID=1121405 RepID=S7TRY3_DESML|nr:molybdate ABC transporter substrate-binding protein [Desulfococcus multivorans]AOY57164.1 ModA: molybdate ABC transporter, periplasmic molybdate-binding protein [Desulfococcus multivorans]AQU99653.1 molybdate ABC transporter substrate-binding protein [Desulfococcus multivorans]EPR39917.1 molybdenum ABC transporter, periplasmic molybdate-binding protein [Desulfococcus multivorans DSM 2059]SKA23055.1 molybdate transport system substrate-binding protein [Desulfococcus multivorans DSM 2059]
MASLKCVLRLLVMVMMVPAGIMGLDAFVGSGAAAETDVLVFAAASTTNALTEIGEQYTAAHPGRRITPSFASSSALAKQIESGAPADIFLSANRKWMDYLAEKDLIATESRFDLLGNRIVLIAPIKSTMPSITVVPGFSLAAALGADGRLSLGDPDHVPAGIYGKKALENLGGWDAVKDRLAPMKDVRAALVLVERGEAPLGLVYATDAAISKKVRVVGTFPEDSHPPIVYPAAAVSGGKTAASRHFLDFLRSPAARMIFEKYGFVVR